jgi:acyl-CoA dehydrogenase
VRHGKEEFLASKLLVGKFYMERIMPETALRKARIETGADTMMELAEDAF